MATDNFDRADGGLGANWTTLEGGFTITSNNARPTTGGANNTVYYSGVTLPDDQFSSCRIVAADDGGPICRVSTGPNYYLGLVRASIVAIYKNVNGSFTLLDSAAGINTDVGHLARLEAQGTAIRLYYNNVLLLNVTDAALASGAGGIYNFGNGGGQYDDFEADALGGGSAVAWMQDSLVLGLPRTRYLPGM